MQGGGAALTDVTALGMQMPRYHVCVHSMRVVSAQAAQSRQPCLSACTYSADWKVGTAFARLRGFCSLSIFQVVRGVVLARRGLEAPQGQMPSLQEAVRALPSEQFRTCLSRVSLSSFQTPPSA